MNEKKGEVRLVSEGKNARLMFPPEFRVGGAKGLVALLSRVLRKKPALVILDAGELARIDTAGLQAIVVVCRALSEAGIAASWERLSPSIADGAALAGLAEAAGMPS
jgi:anti-anti-sigma regulatory factor